MTKNEVIKKLFDIANKPYPSDLYDKRTTGEFNTEDLQRGDYPEGFEEIFKGKA